MLKLLPARAARADSPLRLSALWFGLVLAAGTCLFGAVSYPAKSVDLASGLTGAVGVAFDDVSSHLYFVDYNAGELRRLALTPGCWEPGTPPCGSALTVAGGFTHPEDVALDLDAGDAYVTTRDDTGTTGALWRVDLASGAKSLVTFNLGAPQQIVLDFSDPGRKRAYVAGYDAGRLWHVDLATGVTVSAATGLDHPVGVAVTADRTRAFVTEQGATNALSEIDLPARSKIAEVVTGLTAPFFLAWSDPSETFLYLAERDPANRVLGVDRITWASAPMIDSLPFRPSAVAASPAAGAAFVTTDAKVLRVELAALSMGEPVFLGVGDVPSTAICEGYANTPGYYREFFDSPFGGTLNIFGNLINFAKLEATHYRVKVAHDGGLPAPVTVSWNAYRWNATESRYELTPVGPLPGTDIYAIPAEYHDPPAPHRWKPPFLMLRWPSHDPGLYTFSVEIGTYDDATGTWTDLTHWLPAAQPCIPGIQAPTGNGMTVMIDNQRPEADLVSIHLADSGDAILPCQIVGPGAGCNGYRFKITADDPNGHLWYFRLRALWGKDQSAHIYSDIYAPHHVDEEGPYLWSGVTNLLVPLATTHPHGWAAAADCAHTFDLWVVKRTIDGYYRLYGDWSHQSVTINNTSKPCLP